MQRAHKSKDIIPTILSIAGSDPCGGAGIQADLKTMTALGVYGAAAITCITVQNSWGVSRVEPLPAELVRAQILAVLADQRVTHIKIGMVGSSAIAESLARILEGFSGEVIYDPVMYATTGQPLFGTTASEDLATGLLAAVTVLTPNLPELATLTGVAIHNHDQAVAAAELLLARLPRLRAVLVKGGHAEARGGKDDQLVDQLVFSGPNGSASVCERHPRLHSRNTHGTGCTLASAFAACHCLSGDYVAAFRCSVHYLQTILGHSAAATINKNSVGHGPLLHFARGCCRSGRSR